MRKGDEDGRDGHTSLPRDITCLSFRSVFAILLYPPRAESLAQMFCFLLDLVRSLTMEIGNYGYEDLVIFLPGEEITTTTRNPVQGNPDRNVELAMPQKFII